MTFKIEKLVLFRIFVRKKLSIRRLIQKSWFFNSIRDEAFKSRTRPSKNRRGRHLSPYKLGDLCPDWLERLRQSQMT